MAGHELTISSKGFPGTNFTWRFIQNAFAGPIKALARMSGHKTIMYGVQQALVAPGQPPSLNYSSGFVAYNDEILPFESGAYQATVTIIETVQTAEYANDANNDGQNDVLPTYKTRYMRFGSGGVVTFNFADLVRVSTIKTLSQFELPEDIVIDANYVHTDYNFTLQLLNKLNGIAAGAQVNVKPDWNAAATTPAGIINKPTNLQIVLRKGSVIIGDVMNNPEITVSFVNIDTVNYHVDIKFESVTAAASLATASVWYSVHTKTATSFKLRLKESGNITQNLKVTYELNPL